MEQERSLLIIPIAHSYADMGPLREKVLDDEEYEVVVTQFWLQVFRYLKSLPVDLSCLKVYQDGLANSSRMVVEKIVEESQSANYEILRWLKEQGALIIGTEAPHLLIEHGLILQAIYNSSDEAAKDAARLEYLKKNPPLLEKRDSYIAQRIRETLREGETGLLFIGAAHNVGRLLAAEMAVREPEMLKTPLASALLLSQGF